MATVPLKKRKQLIEALSATSLAVLEEHIPGWDQETPETLSSEQRKLFDVITDFERIAASKIAQVLA